MIFFINQLIEDNLISHQQLSEAMGRQRLTRKPIQELLVEMGFMQESDLLNVMSKRFKIPIFDFNKEGIDPSAIELLSYDLAKRYTVFPVRRENDKLVLVTSSPQDIIAIEDLKLLTQMQIKLLLGSKSEIIQSIEKYYRPSYDGIKELLEDAQEITVEKLMSDKEKDDIGKDTFDVEALKSDNSPVVKLTNFILSEAVKSRATDIHIEPFEKYVDVRYRIDGALRSMMKIQPQLRPCVTARLKILTNLDITETRKFQDGRTRILLNGRKVDVRISVIPTFYGEKLALRLLDHQQARIELSRLGIEGAELDLFIESICRPQGIILVTGPTGSGKTSTLYAAINFIRKSEVKN